MLAAAIVVAAGSGERFGGLKQFLLIDGERLVDRVVRTASQHCGQVIVVLPEGTEWDGPEVAAVATGGARHADSVRRGVEAMMQLAATSGSTPDVVVLASSSHPLASAGLYGRVIGAIAEGADAAAPMGLLADAVKERDGERVLRTVAKAQLVTAQAPCAFSVDVLRTVLASGDSAPEELELVERSGGVVVLVEGEATNIHITTELELAMARRLVGLVEAE